MQEKKKQLKREIGVWGLSANIINIMIGAGIFVLPAIVAAGLGSSSILAYLFCGFLIALVMLCFAEVGSRITTTGGAYAYIETTFGKYYGFITVILFILSTIAADAAVANAIADIIGSIFPFFQPKSIRIIFFFLLFLGLGSINIIGLKEGVGVVKTITIIKIIPLLLIISMGSSDISIANLEWQSIPTLSEIGEISLILFFAFQGAETGLSISGEVKNPNKTIPKAILVSIVSVLIIYILIQTISQGILGDSLANFKENPLAEVAKHIFGPLGFVLITVAAAISMFGNLSSEILSMPRVLFAASKDRVIPINFLSSVHKKYSTPYLSILIYTLFGFLFASLGGFKQLAILSSASILLIYLGVSLATIKLRIANKSSADSNLFKIPGGYSIPILSSLVILWFLSNLSKNELIGIGLFVLLLSIIYLIINTNKKSHSNVIE